MHWRNIAAPQVPIPIQEAAIAAYADESHVEASRKLYREKFDLADQLLSNSFGYKRPPGGFFLWLNVKAHGGGENTTIHLWKTAGLRVVPGSYLAHDTENSNPGEDYIRLAMVQPHTIMREALTRLSHTLNERH